MKTQEREKIYQDKTTGVLYLWYKAPGLYGHCMTPLYNADGTPKNIMDFSTTNDAQTDKKVLQRVFNFNGSNNDIGDYTETEKLFLIEFEKTHGITDYELYDASELTTEILENRKGTWVIERCIGLVTDKQTGDGTLLNYPDPE